MSKSAKLRARANRALNGVKDQILKSRIAAEEVLALQVSKRLRQKEDYGAIVDKYKEENERLRSRLEKLERKEKGISAASPRRISYIVSIGQLLRIRIVKMASTFVSRMPVGNTLLARSTSDYKRPAATGG